MSSDDVAARDERMAALRRQEEAEWESLPRDERDRITSEWAGLMDATARDATGEPARLMSRRAFLKSEPAQAQDPPEDHRSILTRMGDSLADWIWPGGWRR